MRTSKNNETSRNLSASETAKLRTLQNFKRTGEWTPADEGMAAAKADNQAAEEISDDLNPDFIFNGVFTELLSRIAKGEIDANFYARKELANRGLDLNGNWIGFKAAREEHKV